MRRLAPLFALYLPTLAACQQAAAATNEEMTHCIAAFEFAKHHWRSQSPPNHRTAVTLAAGQIYYVQKLKAAGVPDGGQAEAVAFAETNANNPRLMTETLQECGKKQLDDPEFRKQFDALVQVALQLDPVCKRDASVCAKR